MKSSEMSEGASGSLRSVSFMRVARWRRPSDTQMPAEVFPENRKKLLRDSVVVVAPAENQGEVVVAAVPDFHPVDFLGPLSLVDFPQFDGIGVDERQIRFGSALEGCNRRAGSGGSRAPHDDEVVGVFHGFLSRGDSLSGGNRLHQLTQFAVAHADKSRTVWLFAARQFTRHR